VFPVEWKATKLFVNKTKRTHRTKKHNIPADVNLNLVIGQSGSSSENSQSGYLEFFGILIGMSGVGVAEHSYHETDTPADRDCRGAVKSKRENTF
jgi:hypothetical protein